MSWRIPEEAAWETRRREPGGEDVPLRQAITTTVTKHWRNMYDRSGPTPALIDDLVTLVKAHGATMVKAAVVMQAQPPVIVAATDAVPPETAADTPKRTRTRTRGGQRDHPSAG